MKYLRIFLRVLLGVVLACCMALYLMQHQSWFKKGVFWGFVIWLMFWVFQEWFIYHALLGEPILLNILELALLLIGSLTEGIIIAFVLARRIR